jgi:3-oxoacyl-[acyl-carrier-protein] synthase II
MESRAVITGLGLITPLGADVEQTWRALLEGQFISDHARVPSPRPATPLAGREEVRLSGPSRIFELADHAARQATDHARWTAQLISDPSTALVIGTSKGPIEAWMTAPPGSSSDKPLSAGFGLNELAASLAASIGHGCGARATLSAACASGVHALVHAILLLRSGVARRALVVAAEASVHPLFLGSFKRLGVLPKEGFGCRPFDLDRDGFLMSEAAAAVCLESDETSRAIASIERFALGGDATHLTGGDPDGRTLRYLLNRVVDGRPVDLFHAHATGTPFNDPIELAVIESSVASNGRELAPSIYSHKGALGHSLGAAGLVCVVLNCLSHQHGVVPPNVQTRRPIETSRVSIAKDRVQRRIRRSVAIAAGFGGAMGVVSLVS